MRPVRMTAKSSAVCYGGQTACEIRHKPEAWATACWRRQDEPVALRPQPFSYIRLGFFLREESRGFRKTAR